LLPAHPGFMPEGFLVYTSPRLQMRTKRPLREEGSYR